MTHDSKTDAGVSLLGLAEEIEASEGLFKMMPGKDCGIQLGIKKTAQIIAALRTPPVPQCDAEPFEVSDEDWQRALDCAMSCLRPPFHISRSSMDNAMQHAFGILSLRHAAPARCDAGSVREAHAAFDRMLRNNVIEECVKVVEKYGLERVNDAKDYPATIAAELIYHINAIAHLPVTDDK